MAQILKLHSVPKEVYSGEATEFIHNGKDVWRKAEIAKIIAATPDEEAILVAGKNSLVYAAVKVSDGDGGSKVVARIYDTKVFATPANKKRISYSVYSEDEYMDLTEYEEICEERRLATDEELDEINKKIESDLRFVLPTTCHSKILKKLSPTTNPNAKKWRRHCEEQLAELAAEKLYSDSLTNLPVYSEIKLNSEDEIVLVKEVFASHKSPIWVDKKTDKKYKINQIQKMGYELLVKG